MMAMNTKEKIKIFWNKFKEHWVWTLVGFYIGITSMGWIEYFRGYFSLIAVVLPTVIGPIFILVIFYGRKLNNQRVMGRLIIIIGGGLVLGFPIWIFINYLLIIASWAPFHKSNDMTRNLFLILDLILSYGVAGFIMDKLEKKRDYKPFL